MPIRMSLLTSLTLKAKSHTLAHHCLELSMMTEFFSCTVPYDSHKLFMATEHLTCGHSDHRTEFLPLFHFYPFEFKKPHVANSHYKAQYSPRRYFFIQGEREGNNVQRNHYF